jgi:hypothetical protein
MVFGTTYCGISHLPINDGDRCILIPLGFEMKYSFDKWNKASAGSFMYLYTFIYEAQEVIYKGNPDEIEYLDKKYESCLEYELYMLVRKDFYNAIQSEYNKDVKWNISDLRLFKTCSNIWAQAQKIRDDMRPDLLSKINDVPKGEEKEKLISEYLSGGAAPEWMVAIYKVALFMDGMGMIPYPNHCVDQHGNNELYEKIRSSCVEIDTNKTIENEK